MEKISLVVEVPKAPYELMQDTIALIELIHSQLADGFQPAEDGAAIIFSKELVAAVKSLANYKEILDHIKEDKGGAATALFLGVKEAVEKLQK